MKAKWVQIKLGTICDSISTTHKFDKKKIVLINTSDVLAGKVLNHTYVKNKDLRGQFKKSFRCEDILYSEIRPKNRRFAFIDFNAEDYVASTKLMVIRSNKKYVLPQYLFQILKSDPVINQLHMLAETRSGTFPQITFKELSNIPFSLPPLIEQRAIAATLSCLDDKIEINNKINANLEAQAQTIFKSWFVNFEPLQDGEFVESELGMIPRGWHVRKLGDIARYVGERIPVSHCNTENYISTENMQANKQGVIEATSLPSMPAVSRYEEHDILISNIRPYFKKIWFSDKVGGCSNDVLVFRARHAAFIGVLYSVLYSDTFFEHATATSKGTKMPRGDKTAIMSYPIALPAMPESSIYIQQLNTIVLEFQKKITGLRKENQALAALHDTLLPKLMSGQIEVPMEVQNANT